MNFNYKNPISPITSLGVISVPRTEVYGTNFSVLSTGGFMEVYSVNDLYYTIPSGSTGLIEYTGNTIPIQFQKGTGSVFSPDVLTLNSDNISSGRRRIGMLVYVIDQDQIYQYQIPNFENLWTGATTATGPGGPTVVISDFGTTIKSNSPEGIAFISAWTANTIEGISGETSSTAVWKKLVTGGGGGVSGDYLPLSGGTVTGDTIFTSGLTANTFSASTYLGLPQDVFVTGGTYANGTLYLTNNSGSTFSVAGFSTATGGTSNYYGSFSDTTNQSVSGANTATVWTYNTTELSNGIYIQDGSKIKVSNDGIYEIGYSAQIEKTQGGTSSDVTIWAAVNGNPVVRSSSTLTLANNSVYQLPFVSYIFELYAGDYVEFYFSSPSQYIQITTLSGLTSPTRPVSPSVIIGAKAIGNAVLNTSGDSFVTGFSLTNDTLTLSQNRVGLYSGFSVNLPYLNTSGGTITGNLSVSGSVSATTYYGNGSNLTGISRGGGGGAGGQLYYFNISNTQTPYYEFSTTATTAAEQTISATASSNATVLIGGFMTPSTLPNITNFPAGILSFYFHTYDGGTNHSFNIYGELYKRTTGGTETLLFTSDVAAVVGNVVTMVISDGYFSGATLNSSDRLVVKVYGTNLTNQTRTIYLVSEGSTYYSFALTTIPTFTDTYVTGFTYSNNTLTIKQNNNQADLTATINTFTGLTANTISATTYQNLPTSGTVTSVSALILGTIGTDLSSTVANSTSTPVITLNVPTASATNRGVLSSSDWTTFNNKQDTISIGTINSQAKVANGLVLTSNILYTQTADATNVGMVSTGAQTFAGVKTFNDIVNFNNVNFYTSFQTNTNFPSIYGIAVGSQFGSIVIQGRSASNNSSVYIVTGPTPTQRAQFGNTGFVYLGSAVATGFNGAGLSVTSPNSGSGTAGVNVAGTVITQTITAGANNQAMYGFFLKPTFSNGAFTGLQNIVSTIQTSAGNNILNATDAGAITIGYSGATYTLSGAGTFSNSAFSSVVISSGSYTGNNGSHFIVNPTITNNSASGFVAAQTISGTISAGANNALHIGLNLNTTFSAGAFTGTNFYDIQFTRNNPLVNYSSGELTFRSAGTSNFVLASGAGGFLSTKGKLGGVTGGAVNSLDVQGDSYFGGSTTAPTASARVHIVGASATTGTALLVTNSTPTTILRVDNNQDLYLGSSAGKVGFYAVTPILRPTTGIAGATRVGGAGTTVTTTDTYGGYTIAQMAQAMINLGLLT